MTAPRPATLPRRGFLAGASASLVLLASASRAGGSTPTQAGLESSLTCQCGCGLTVHSCNHLNCGSSIPLKKEISEQIALGGTEEEILSRFQAKYGEKILSAPTTTGFNLAAWTMPFVGIGLGAAAIGWVLVRWRRGAGSRTEPSVAAGPPGGDPGNRDRIEAALRDWDARS